MNDSECASPAQQPADARKEHERALNRERQRRLRDRRRHEKSPLVTDSNGNPSYRLTKLAVNLAHGMPEADALRSIGASVNSRGLKELDSVKERIRKEIAQVGITRYRYYANILRRDSATKQLPQGSGYIEVPDWTAQASSARDQRSVLISGGEMEEHESQIGTQYNVSLIMFSGTPPPPVVSRAHDNSEDSQVIELQGPEK